MENIPLLIIGVLPSLIWLFYFLKKDKDPEPKIMIFTVFVLGVGGALLAASLQVPVRNFIYSINLTDLSQPKIALIGILDAFLVVALLEESVKLLAVIAGVFLFKIRELDEPVDLIIYMITAGLGFAALENYLYFSRVPQEQLTELIFLRFAITTLFHALSAGILGYLLALSIRKMKKYIAVLGLVIVSFFHALYNVLIELMAEKEALLYPSLLLGLIFILALALLGSIKKTKEMESICEPF